MTYYLVVYKVTFLIDILRNTDLSKTLLFKTSFLFQNLFPFFMQSHVFLCLYTIQVCEFYVPLSSFFLFLYFVQISNMDDNTNYQEDYEEYLLSDIFPIREQTSGQKNLTFGIIMKHMI